MEGIEEISVPDSNSEPQKELGLGFRSPDTDPQPAEEIRVAEEFRNLGVNESQVDEDGGHNPATEEEVVVKEDNCEVLFGNEHGREEDGGTGSGNEHGSEEDGGTVSGNDGDSEGNGVNLGSNEDQKEHEGGENGVVEGLAVKGGGNDRESEENGKGSENEEWKRGNGNYYGGGDGGEDDSAAAVAASVKMWRDGEVTSGKRLNYPLRPEAEDCSFYIRTGMCKFGMNCKFNHPFRRKNQVGKVKVKEMDEFPERPGQEDCKYYLKTGVCKYGKACRYNHTGRKSAVVAIVDFNFLGLPIRPGEKECSYYMRTGACKYGSSCRFNHPDPMTGGHKNMTSDLSNSLGGASESIMPPWSSQRPLHETASCAPTIFPSSPSNPKWNGYQASLYSPERSMHPTPYVINNSTIEMNVYPQQQQMVAENFPQRPGQPECSYFLKTGDCKYGSSCKYHHPKKQPSQLPPCSFSEEGLPLRPGQSTCAYYDRYGICKFGPACKFDHPLNHSYSPASGMTGPGQPPYFGNSA